MPIDTSIFQNALRPPPSVGELDAQNQQFQQNQLALQNTRQAQADANSLRSATQQFGNDPGQNLQTLQKAGLYAPAQGYQKAIFDNQKTQAETGKNLSEIPLNGAKVGEQDALSASHQLDTKIAANNFHLQQLGGITDISQVPGWVADGVKSGVLDFDKSKQGLAAFLADAQQNGLDAAKTKAMQGGMSATDQLKQQQAALIAQNAQTGENARNAATNQTHLQTTNMTQAGENSRAAAGRAQALTIAGIGPNGSLSDDGERTAQAIAAGQLQPPSGMALTNPKNQRILGRVMEINPEYDSTSVTAKKKAANDFATGPLGNSMRSFAVAGQHLDQLGTLVDALNNGNIQAVNNIGNKFAEQTGNPAPTNFDAAKDVVSKEVVKAIVAGGGGVAEREELSKLMSNAKSPAQLKGVITQYRNLMGAQHDALLQQRRAAGLPDSTLPSYTDANGGASTPSAVAHPPDIQSLLNKYGTK